MIRSSVNKNDIYCCCFYVSGDVRSSWRRKIHRPLWKRRPSMPRLLVLWSNFSAKKFQIFQWKHSTTFQLKKPLNTYFPIVYFGNVRNIKNFKFGFRRDVRSFGRLWNTFINSVVTFDGVLDNKTKNNRGLFDGKFTKMRTSLFLHSQRASYCRR
jgi:hypothetical protein